MNSEALWERLARDADRVQELDRQQADEADLLEWIILTEENNEDK